MVRDRPPGQGTRLTVPAGTPRRAARPPAPPPAPAPGDPSVRLLDADPELAEGIPQDELPVARQAVVLPAVALPVGRWAPEPPHTYGAGVTGLLVVSGLLTRAVQLEARAPLEMHGPGDLLDPWHHEQALLPVRVVWAVNEPTVVAVLDQRFAAACRRWPALPLNLRRRLAEQAERSAVLNAIGQLPRVENRVLAVLWHLAERYGRVAADGVVVPLDLTHATLGRLVGAQRSTVTLAITELTERDLLARRENGAWVVAERSRELLRPRPELESKAPATGVTLLPVPDDAGRPFERRDTTRARAQRLRLGVAELRRAMDSRTLRTQALVDQTRETVDRSQEARRTSRERREHRSNP